MYDGGLLRVRRSRDRLLEEIRDAKFIAEVPEKTFSRLPLPPVTEEIVSAISSARHADFNLVFWAWLGAVALANHGRASVYLLPLRSFWIFSRKLMKKFCSITKSSMSRLPLTTECGLVVCESFVTPTPVREILNSMRKCYKARKKRKPNCCLHVLHFLSSQAPPIPNAWLSKVLWEGLIQRAYHCPKGQWISSANIGQANPMLRIVFHVGRL